MKKCLFITFLIFLNCTVLYTKIFSNELKNIKLNLKDEELAIVIIDLENSTSLLLKKEDNYILYILRYIDDKDLYLNIEIFTNNIDYVFMNEEYDIKYPNKMVIDGNILIDGIRIEPSKIYYKNKSFCINSTNKCNYIYLIDELEIKKPLDGIFYNQYLPEHYIEKLHDLWIDTYKITKNDYTILIIGKNDEILNLQREY